MTQDISYKEKMTNKALYVVRKLAQGNSGVKESVQLIQNSFEDLHCESLTHIELSYETQNQKLKGVVEEGDPVRDPTQIPDLVQKSKEKFLKSTDIRNALSDLLLKRPDKGFAVHGKTIDLPHMQQQYYFIQSCAACQGKKSTNCGKCNGARQEQCGQCHGRTTINCQLCRGAGTVSGPDGKSKNCTQCYGKATISCPLCRARGTVSCRICKGSGGVKCGTCNGIGVHTHISKILYKMNTSFEIDRAALPDVAIKMIENKGAAMVRDKHIALKAEQIKPEDGSLAIQYDIKFPFSNCTVNVNGKPVKVMLLGYHAKIMKMGNFIDQMIEKNYALLIRAGNDDGNITSHIQKSSKSKIIAEGLMMAASYNRKDATLRLKKKFPFGASNQIIKDIIMQSKRGLSNVSKKNQYGGIAAGLGVSAVLMAIYFLFMGRRFVQESLKIDGALLIVTDFIWIPISILLSLALSKALAKSPLKKVLSPIMNKKQLEHFKPRTNNNYLPIIGGSIALFVIIVFLTRYIGNNIISWMP